MAFDPAFIPGETIPLPRLGPDLVSHAHDDGVPLDHPHLLERRT